MRASLQTVLASVQDLQPEEVPALLGELEVIKATALLRLSQPPPPVQADELLHVDAAAQRLGMSAQYLYRHADTLPFTKRNGRSLRFSSRGIEQYINRRR